jgi:hypothetical protein
LILIELTAVTATTALEAAAVEVAVPTTVGVVGSLLSGIVISFPG